MTGLRRSTSAWLIRLADRVDPRPAYTEREELFDAISALLAEPNCEVSPLNGASQGGC